MARMEMDCNLKKLANFFKFFLYIVEKSLKTDYSFLFSAESLCIFSPILEEQFHVRKKGSLSNICAVLTKIQKNHHDNAPLIKVTPEDPLCFMFFRSCVLCFYSNSRCCSCPNTGFHSGFSIQKMEKEKKIAWSCNFGGRSAHKYHLQRQSKL